MACGMQEFLHSLFSPHLPSFLILQVLQPLSRPQAEREKEAELIHFP